MEKQADLIQSPSPEKPYLKEVYEIFNVVAWTKLTPEEQSWIRKAEVPKPDVKVNKPKEQLFDMSLCVLRRQKENRLQLESIRDPMPPYSFEVFSTAARFTDKVDNNEPVTIVAEESLVKAFINQVVDSPNPVDVAKQLDILLELSGGSIVDAAAIGMMASRIVARNLDKKTYPNIHVDKSMQEKFHDNLPIFGNPDKQNDRLGDNYYFWTSVYTACSLSKEHPIVRTLDEHNAEIMTISRQFFARQPTITNHKEADKLGKQAAEIFINVTQKPESDQTFTQVDYLESLPESARVAVLVNKLEQMKSGEEITISDPDGIIAKGLYSFNTLEYFSALPGVSSIYKKAPKDWNAILSEVRFKVPSVYFSLDSEGLKIKKRQSELSTNLKNEDIDINWMNDQVDRITNEDGRRMLEQWIAIGVSTTDSSDISIRGQKMFKYNAMQNLSIMIQNTDERRKYFSDDEWEKVIDIISISIDNSQGFSDGSTVFRRTFDKLARSVFVLPSDVVVPHVNMDLVRAVDGIDSTKVAREDKMNAFTETMTDLDWYEENKDNLAKLAQVDPFLRNIAVFYLRQNVLDFLSKDMEKARNTTQKTFSKVLNQLHRGSETEKQAASEALNIIYQIGLEYESDPVFSLLAAMHDPSVYGTARYGLERRMIKTSNSKLPIVFANQIVKLTKTSPKSIIRHQNSLSRKLTCPSCYSYAGGLAAQSEIQSRGFGDSPKITEVPDPKILFTNELGEWVRSRIV